MDQSSIELLQAVNSFYSESFSNLMLLTVAILTLIGVIIPVFIEVFRARQHRISKDELETHLSNQVESIKISLMEELDGLLEHEKEKFRDEIEEHNKKVWERVSFAIAGVYFIQGLHRSEYPDIALSSFVEAAKHAMKSGEESNLNRALRHAVDHGRLITGWDRESHRQDALYQLDTLIDELKKFDSTRRYFDIITELEELRETIESSTTIGTSA